MSEIKKPKVKLIGEDGNVFNLMGLCVKALRKAGQGDKVKEMQDKIIHCEDYSIALGIMSEYCEVE